MCWGVMGGQLCLGRVTAPPRKQVGEDVEAQQLVGSTRASKRSLAAPLRSRAGGGSAVLGSLSGGQALRGNTHAAITTAFIVQSAATLHSRAYAATSWRALVFMNAWKWSRPRHALRESIDTSVNAGGIGAVNWRQSAARGTPVCFRR